MNGFSVWLLPFGYCLSVDYSCISLSVKDEENERISSKCYLRLRTSLISVDRNVLEISTIFTHIKRPNCSQHGLAVEFNGWRSAFEFLKRWKFFGLISKFHPRFSHPVETVFSFFWLALDVFWSWLRCRYMSRGSFIRL